MQPAGGRFVQLDVQSGAVVRRLPAPARLASAAAEYDMSRVTVNADWSRFAGVAGAEFVTWPGDRAEPRAAPDPAGV